LELRALVSVLRARYKLIIAIIALAGLGALAASLAAEKSYDSVAKVIVGQSLSAPNPDLSQLAASQQLSTTYAQIATTRQIMQGVVDKLGLNVDAGTLQRQVSVETSTDSALLTIRARDSDPQRSAAIANGVAAQLIAYSPTVEGQSSDVQQFVLHDIETLQDEIASTQAEADRLSRLGSPTPSDGAKLETLQSRLLSLRSIYASLLAYASNSAVNHLAIVESAVVPSAPSSPQVAANVLLGIAAGTLLAVAFVLLLDHLADRIKTRDDVERAVGLPVLGLIPRIRDEPRRNAIYRLVTVLYPRSRATEAFRALRTNIEFAAIAATTRTILITSAEPREGKTTVACNLAVVFAQAGKRTILVDADLRVAGVHELFALPRSLGLTDLMLSDGIAIDSVAQVTELENLRVIVSGSPAPNPAELLGSERMRTIVDRLAAAADIVIFDCSPVNVVTDPVVLSTIVDGSILVIDSGHTRRASARAAAHALSMVGGRMLGLTLNRIPRTSPDETYGYSDDAASLPAPDTSVRGVEGFVPFKQSVRQSASAQQTPGAGGQPAARESSR